MISIGSLGWEGYSGLTWLDALASGCDLEECEQYGFYHFSPKMDFGALDFEVVRTN